MGGTGGSPFAEKVRTIPNEVPKSRRAGQPRGAMITTRTPYRDLGLIAGGANELLGFPVSG